MGLCGNPNTIIVPIENNMRPATMRKTASIREAQSGEEGGLQREIMFSFQFFPDCSSASNLSRRPMVELCPSTAYFFVSSHCYTVLNFMRVMSPVFPPSSVNSVVT